MSKGEIIRHEGEGKYTVRQTFAVDRIRSEIDSLAERVSELAVLLPEAKLEALQNSQKVGVIRSIIDSLIPLLQTDPEDARDKISQNQAALVRASSDLRLSEIKAAQLISENLSVLKRRNQLESAPDGVNVEAWCADYTEDLSGEVGLADINDEGGRGFVIHPGYEGAALYNPGRDGAIFPNIAQSGPQIYFNAAVLPGVQKWMPRYRKGEILSIKGDLCTVELEPAKSSAQNLDINRDAVLHEIPIQYMDCNSDAFEEGDKVVVRFFDSGPQVIGFESNPRSCGIDVALISQEHRLGVAAKRVSRLLRITKKPIPTDSSPISPASTGLSLYNGRVYRIDDSSGNVSGIPSIPEVYYVQSVCAVNSAVSGRKEIWVYGSERQQSGGQYDPDDEIWAVIRIFDDNGHQVTRKVIFTPPVYYGGVLSLSVSPHYYAVTVGVGAGGYDQEAVYIKKISDDSLVRSFTYMLDSELSQTRTNPIDITDELIVWTDQSSVYCELIQSGQAIPISVDTDFLTDYLIYSTWTNKVVIECLQLSNRMLAVIGCKNLILYRINRDPNGIPIGFSEYARHQYSDVTTSFSWASSDRALLKAIPPM